MDNVLGHDIDGRPLRAGDEVLLIKATARSWVPLMGRRLTISGIYQGNGWMLTVKEAPADFGTNPKRLRKLHDDHRPADESFEDMMNNLKSPEKMGEMR